MKAQKEYEVLRLIGHNRICYVSSDVVKGCLLVNWLEREQYLSKEQFFKWVHDIVKQLVQIHKCRGNPCYQYVNPYNLVVSEEGKLCFLNMTADSNQERVKLMQRTNIREYFLPGGYSYQDADEELDIYGLGKTIQYLLAFSEIKPTLTGKEERKIRKIISRCITVDGKRGFKEMIAVQECLMKLDVNA